MGYIDDKINNYDFSDDTQFIPQTFDCKYDIEISDDDKILSLMEDGKLLARIGLTYEKNVLKLNGRDDDTEIASVELPNSLVELKSFTLEDGEEGKEIVLTFLQSDGTETEISLNVEELATVYKAGAGLSLSDDNTFSIKLKNGSFLGFTDNDELDISLAGVYPTIAEVTDEFNKYNARLTADETKIDALGEISGIAYSAESVANSAMTEITKEDGINDHLATLDEEISELKQYSGFDKSDYEETISAINDNFDAIESALTAEIADRISGDTELKDYIDSVNSALTEDIVNVQNEIPTSASQLVNDANYITANEIDGWGEKIAQISAITAWIDGNDDAKKILAVTEDVNELKEQVSSLTKTVEAIPIIADGTISSITKSIDELEEKVSELSAITDSIDLSIYAKNSDIDELNTKFYSAKEAINDNQASLKLQSDAIGELENRTTVLEAKHVEYNNSLSGLQESVDSINSENYNINQTMNILNGRISTLETNYSAMNDQIIDILKRLTDVENKLA